MRARAAPFLPAALAAALSGCASVASPGYEMTDMQWKAAVARTGVDPAAVPNPMAVSPEMREAARVFASTGMDSVRLERLQNVLLDRRQWAFEYEKSSTFTAIEAFGSRRGNCVSFTNLFIALGRTLGIRLQAALVSTRGSSERTGDVIVTYNHMVAVNPLPNGASVRVYDFFGSDAESIGRFVVLDDVAVAAIRASNHGIEDLSRGETAEARRELETAVKLAPTLGSLHANLGLARWRAGDIPGAFEALRRGLQVDPASPPVHQNLAALYLEQGRGDEARAALGALDVGRASPFALIVRGDLSLGAGDVKAALRDYREAASVDGKLAEPWIRVARAELARGRPEASRKAAMKALRRDPANDEARRLAGEAR